jgi:hypothetical protein
MEIIDVLELQEIEAAAEYEELPQSFESVGC